MVVIEKDNKSGYERILSKLNELLKKIIIKLFLFNVVWGRLIQRNRGGGEYSYYDWRMLGSKTVGRVLHRWVQNL